MEDSGFISTYAEFLKTIGEKNRLQIIFALQEGAKSVSEITEVTDLSQPLVSFHLRTLRERGIVETERENTFIYYSLKDDDLIENLTNLSKHLSYYQADKTSFDFEWPPWKNCKFFKNLSD